MYYYGIFSCHFTIYYTGWGDYFTKYSKISGTLHIIFLVYVLIILLMNTYKVIGILVSNEKETYSKTGFFFITLVFSFWLEHLLNHSFT
jgi:hypothetical protein